MYHQEISAEVLGVINGRELLIQHLGYWSSFHDFEVLAIVLDRPLLVVGACDLRATFFGFDLNKAPDDPERKQCTIEMSFEGIADLRIDGFNHQNPILGLSIVSKANQQFRVEWGGTGIRHEVSFACSRISVLRVVDLNPYGKPSPSL